MERFGSDMRMVAGGRCGSVNGAGRFALGWTARAAGTAMLDLYYWPTPNGHKITLLLEELAEAGAAQPWRIVPVDIGKGAQFEPAFLAISPNNKMPALVDHAPADGEIGRASCREKSVGVGG